MSTDLFLPPASAPFPPSLGRLLATAGVFATFCATVLAGPAENAVEVERLVALGSYGKKPVLWYLRDADHNRGSGEKGWTATSGGKLSARGSDPWGQANGAFGLPTGAAGGAAVSGSKAIPPIHTTGGSVLLFCRPATNSKPPMLLFSNADWGQPGYLSLRINEVKGRWELTLATSNPSSSTPATQANFATLQPGAWAFIALSWQQAGDRCSFRYWAGSLAANELTYGELETAPIADAKPMFMLAGRRADQSGSSGLPSLAFEGGLLNNFAIYDVPLSEETVQRIYLAATRP